MSISRNGSGSLASPVGPLRFFALAFGCTIGSAWVVVLGEWLGRAGPGGTILGFCVGATVMAAVAACYAELISRFPHTGGEIVYAYEVFGPKAAFFTGWFLTLSMISVGAFEATALGWISSILWPSAQGRTLYSLFGEPMHAGSLVLGITTLLGLSWLNYRGTGTSTQFQSIVTISFLVISFFIVILGLNHGHLDRVYPLFQMRDGHVRWTGILWIIGTSPFFLNGFQAAAQAIEERTASTSFSNVAGAMFAAVLLAGAFYCAIVLACSSVVPWKSLVNTPLATAAAMDSVMTGGLLSRIVLVTAAISILKTWNGVILWAARLVLAQARARFLPNSFAAIHPRYRTPHRAIVCVAGANLLGLLLGRGALLPIVGMAAICLSFSLVVACLAALLSRQRHIGRAPYAVPGGLFTIFYALIGSMAMAVEALISPRLEAGHGVPLEWSAMICWATLGIGFWIFAGSQREKLGVDYCRAALLNQGHIHGDLHD